MSMVIESRLERFQAQVGAKLSELETFKNELFDDIGILILINNNVVSQLNTVFQSNGGTSTLAQLEYINQTVKKINQSLESELGTTITECKSLNDDITNLKGILSSYNSTLSELNSLEEDDSGRGELQSKLSGLEKDFSQKNSELCTVHDNLLKKDATAIILEEFRKPETETKTEIETLVDSDPSINIGFAGTDKTASIFYEVDGVVYQKILPYYISGGGLAATYTVAYDKNAILKAAGNSDTGKQAIEYLEKLVKEGPKRKALWDMHGGYSKQKRAEIAEVMNVVLEGTYQVNNCKSISDYAIMSSIVASNSLVFIDYTRNGDTFNRGFGTLVSGGCDCIGFVEWAYYQGISKVNNLGDRQPGKLDDVTCANLNSGTEIAKMSLPDRGGIKPGSIVTRSDHVGIVVDVINKDGKKAVVIAHSTPGADGIVTYTWPVDKLTNDWRRVLPVEEMVKRATVGRTNA